MRLVRLAAMSKSAMDKLRASLTQGHASRRARADEEARSGSDVAGEGITANGGAAKEQKNGTPNAGSGIASGGVGGKGHLLVSRRAVEMITTAAALREFIAHARDVGSVAYDSEFIGELTYRPVICLVQLATHERIALVDPIAATGGDGLDLLPLWDLIADERVEKVVHAGEQDLEPVVRFSGKPPARVFDLQVAAGFCGYGYPLSLAKLVATTVGVTLTKGHTFTNWQARPLTSSQLRYAADDVRYLPAIRASLGREVEARGHGDAMAEEMTRMCDAGRYVFDAAVQVNRVRGGGALEGKSASVLRELVIWRDEVAKSANLPPRVVVKDEVVVDIARLMPKSVDKLDRVKGLPKPVEAEHGGEIIDAVSRGLAVGVAARVDSEDTREMTPRQKFQADAAMNAMSLLCAGSGVDVQLAASRADLMEFLYWRLRGMSGDTPRLMAGWRAKVIGEPLLKMLNGQASIKLTWKGEEAVGEVECL